MPPFRSILIVACVLTAGGTLPAVAQPYYSRDPGDGYAYGPGVDYAPRTRVAPPRGYYEGRSAQQIEQDENHRSGTLGRQGLGADPRHPEGPGNQSLGGTR